MQLTADPECSMDALAEVVSIDPVLGLRILSLANSSAFALSRRLSDVRQAVSVLGLRSIRNLALGLLVSDLAPQTPHGQRLLEQSIRRGTACRLIAEHLGVKAVHEFFTAGLLLDVGLMSLARTDAKLAAELSSMASASRSVREKVLGLTPHAELSGKMAQECLLPDATVAAIAAHHDDEPGESPLEQATWFAERVAALFDSALVERDREQLLLDGTKLGFTEEVIEDILVRTPVEVSETAQAFQRQLPPQQTIGDLKANAYQQLIELNGEYEVIVNDLERALAEKSALEAQLRVANDLLSGLANTDELTGLPNRRALQASVEYQLTVAEGTARPLSLVMVDVDHFKNFNDTMGHAAGDAVLRVLGALLQELVRGVDIPARYGG
ncbi:MAG: GGDEF domain-containing protein, partial [Nannocystaceae bacterium]|nr:GGDEF domain-containing protein [Nannocystaceae bacterium]